MPLLLVPTPLGNLDDCSARARQALADARILACEDTRVTTQLLYALGLSPQGKKLFSYHEHNAKSREAGVLDLLAAGETVTLVSDAGMPCISDPGQRLVEAAVAAGYSVRALPGPNAALTVLAASGLDSHSFVFVGFLPQQGGERKKALAALATEARTQLLYEAPHRLLQLLTELMAAGLGARRLCIGRELTKTYEELRHETVEAALAHFQETAPRGEFSLVLEGAAAYLARCPEAQAAAAEDANKAAEQRLRALAAEGLRLSEAVRQVRKETGLAKQFLYSLALEIFDEKA